MLIVEKNMFGSYSIFTFLVMKLTLDIMKLLILLIQANLKKSIQDISLQVY